ncbi:hypothetical protein PB10_23c [Pseudomonas phage PB10]|nr:hypothetical protein PB10_23c [Pseudomonas phage PB10]
MKKEPIRLSSMASARAIDAEFAFRMDEFMARVAKEHEALAARLNAEHLVLWDEIRAVAGLSATDFPNIAGLSATDFPNIAMAHDTADGKLYVMDADELERVRQACPCPDCEAARAESMPSQASGGIH